MIGVDEADEERRQAIRWGAIPPEHVRLPLQLRGGSRGLVASADELGVTHPAPTRPIVEPPRVEVDLDVSPSEDLIDLPGGPQEELAAARGQDPIGRYLKEIGKAKLLTAAQEVETGKRIEAGQAQLRRQLAGIPLTLRSLADLAVRVRATGGGAPEASTLRRRQRPSRHARRQLSPPWERFKLVRQRLTRSGTAVAPPLGRRRAVKEGTAMALELWRP